MHDAECKLGTHAQNIEVRHIRERRCRRRRQESSPKLAVKKGNKKKEDRMK